MEREDLRDQGCPGGSETPLLRGCFRPLPCPTPGKVAREWGGPPSGRAPQPAPEVAPPPPTAAVEPDKPDDLTRIRGIGAGIQYRLNRGGVWTFAQLARLKPEDIYELTGVSVKSAIRQRLIEQAEELAAEAGSSD